jgi:hypothetical protein
MPYSKTSHVKSYHRDFNNSLEKSPSDRRSKHYLLLPNPHLLTIYNHLQVKKIQSSTAVHIK